MAVFDRLPSDMLRKMRDLMARLVPDAEGNVTETFPGRGADGKPLALTVNLAATLAAFDAAIARHKPETPQEISP